MLLDRTELIHCEAIHTK